MSYLRALCLIVFVTFTNAYPAGEDGSLPNVEVATEAVDTTIPIENVPEQEASGTTVVDEGVAPEEIVTEPNLDEKATPKETATESNVDDKVKHEEGDTKSIGDEKVKPEESGTKPVQGKEKPEDSATEKSKDKTPGTFVPTLIEEPDDSVYDEGSYEYDSAGGFHSKIVLGYHVPTPQCYYHEGLASVICV